MKKLGWCAVALLVGCGGSAYDYAETSGSAQAVSRETTGGYADVPMAPPAEATVSAEADYGGAAGDDMSAWESVPDDEPAAVARAEAPARPMEQYAQNQPPPQTGATGGQPAQPATAEQTDAVDLSGPLLIYTAQIHLGVYEVEATQETVIGIVDEVHGFLAQRTDNMIVVRVPAPVFTSVLDRIEEAGDVLHRQVEALDVGEEFRDLAIRIRNAEAMRDRLEQLLRQASNVEEALAVERELQRLTESIEQMKGRQRWLSDRIAFSTITIYFQPRATENINPDPFRLPFQWLDTLGLSNLLSL